MVRETEKELEKVLKALANRRRLAIVTVLKRSSHMPVGDIAEKIKLSFKATSKHLSILASAELIDRGSRDSSCVITLRKIYPLLFETLIKAL